MKRLFLLLALVLAMPAMAQVTLTDLKVNHLSAPEGLTDRTPSFSWILKGDTRGLMQSAYEVAVYKGGKCVWSSGKVKSENSLTVPYEGPELQSGIRYTWKVRVWDNKGKVSKWSERASWLTGMLTPNEWQAKWIEPQRQTAESPLMRREFSVNKPVASAVAYVTAHGMYEALINGEKVGDAHYAPGWTSYHYRLQYQAYDVTRMLQQGQNSLAAVVSPGWYSGGMGTGNPKNRYKYGKDVSLLMQVNIEYSDGTKESIVTDGSWECCVPAEESSALAGGMVFANIYDGQTIDARLVDTTWASNTPKTAWNRKVKVLDLPKNHLVPTLNEPVKAYEAIPAKNLIVTPKGERVIDFGQNIVGWERVKLSGKEGDRIRITHAEVLDKDGNFYTENMREAKTTSLFILKGKGTETFEPRHTFYGFRYIKVEGLEGDIQLEDFEAVPVCSGFDRIGSFSSSNPVINQLQHNIEWGFWDNFVDVPTDCPQRDERLGWTGDAQVFFRTASFLGKVDNFFNKWLADLKVDQRTDGRVPRIIPDIYWYGDYRTAAPGWADAATIIPWNHYMAFGNIQILEQQYDSMKGWVDYMVSQSKDRGWLWNNGSHYGDWLFYSLSNDPGGQSAVTSSHLVAQCFFAHSVDLVCRTAQLLGKQSDADYYAEVAAKVREAYMNEYVTPNGLISSDTQTAYVLALQFNMLPEAFHRKDHELKSFIIVLIGVCVSVATILFVNMVGGHSH